MADVLQWTITAAQALVIAGHTPRAGEASYVTGNSNRAEVAIVVASLVQTQPTFNRLDKKAFRVTEAAVIAALRRAGETIPPGSIMWVKPLSSGERVLTITPDTPLGRL